MSTLRSTIDRLASQFAGSIIEALRGASLDELMEVAGAHGGARRGRPGAAARGEGGDFGARRRGRGGRLSRRTADDIARMIDEIVGLLQKNGDGMRAEQIREALGVEAKELPRPLADAVSSGRITKTGQKRATTYFVGSGEGARKRSGRRGGGRKKKAAA